MMQLSGLLAAIQKGAEAAAEALRDQNRRILLGYFHSSKISGDIDNAAEDELIPHMVTIKYPRQTPQGPVEHKVHVPLISLSPVSQLTISEMNFEIDVEIAEQDGEIMVGFPNVKKNILGREKVIMSKSNAKLTISMSAGEHPFGISTIIEGYDKALRGQIPS